MSNSEQIQESATNETGGTAGITRAQRLLLDFLRDSDPPTWNDAPVCPVCGYNLKALTRPVCPECRHDLVLTVGVARLRLAWLLVAMVPAFFCGIAACFIAIPTTAVFFEDGEIVWPLVGAVLFGWSSGLFAIMLAVKHRRFIAQPRTRQKWTAVIIWFIHFAALVLLIAWLAPQI